MSASSIEPVTFWGWLASDLTGTIGAPLNPELGPLQNNGGSTPTMALLPNSAAIDAGRLTRTLKCGCR